MEGSIRANNYTRHHNSCNGAKTNVTSLACEYCSKIFTTKSGCGLHQIQCKFNPNRRKIHTGKTSWNKGLTKETDDRVAKGAKTLKHNIEHGITIIVGHPHTNESKQKLSDIAISNKLGGVRQSKRIKYKNVSLGSSYELSVAISLDENEIRWIIPDRFDYTDPNGKRRTYTPDFYLPDFDVYLDPKNDFLIENINPVLGFKDSEKINLVERHHNIRVIILNKHQLKWDKILELL